MGLPFWGRSLVAREVRGIEEFGSEDEFYASSLSSIFDSNRMEDYLVREGVGMSKEMMRTKGDDVVGVVRGLKSVRGASLPLSPFMGTSGFSWKATHTLLSSKPLSP